MSELIKKLMDESGVSYLSSVHPDMLKNFAELIIRECIDELNVHRLDNPEAAWQEERNDGIDFCIDAIKERFGLGE